MLLAIDTASQVLSVALFDGVQIWGEISLRTPNRHTVQLSPLIQRLLEDLELRPAALSALGISQGFGSYSGLRVGFGVAKGLAIGLNIPLIPIPTLDIVAAATPFGAGDLWTVIPAGRKRIIAGAYKWQENTWQKQERVINTTWEELLAQIESPALISGEIDPLGQSLLQTAPNGVKWVSFAAQLRRAGYLAALAWQAFQHGNFPQDVADVNPLYLKDA